MSVRTRRRAEQGQALILALALLGLLSAFSVALLRLSSSSSITSSSVRQSAYREAETAAGASAARQMVAKGLGCSATPITTTFAAGETITVTVTQKPATCVPPDPLDNDEAVPGDYVLCSSVNASGGPYAATVAVSARSSGAGSSLSIDIVHLEYRSNPPC